MLGMKIGAHSRIMMKVIVTLPWNITIGQNTVINEYCYLDGRGGLTIGSNVNIALYSMLITGTHDYKTKGFDFITEPIKIEDGVWLGARSMILNGAVLQQQCIIGAGSVVAPRTVCERNTIYNGLPARKSKDRNLTQELEISNWKVFFR